MYQTSANPHILYGSRKDATRKDATRKDATRKDAPVERCGSFFPAQKDAAGGKMRSKKDAAKKDAAEERCGKGKMRILS